MAVLRYPSSPRGLMRVLHVTPEYYPLIKTGGLADVSGALPPALAGLGGDVRLLLPGYPAVLDGLDGKTTVKVLTGLPGAAEAKLEFGRTPDGVPAYALNAPALYHRAGNPYLDAAGNDWPDNHLRFAALGWVAAEFADHWLGDPWRPDVLHGHDWQSGLMPAYVALNKNAHINRPATVMTIHNIAYQGQFSPAILDAVKLPKHCFQIEGVEYYGAVGFLKAGLYYADRLTTVSPSYAREIQTEEHGCGLDGLLAHRTDHLSGILNGVDYQIWNPATDNHLPARYDANSLAGKAVNKAALQAEFGLEPRPDAPLFTLITRLNWHKGVDMVLEALPTLIARGGQLVVLGSGDKGLEEGFRRLAAAHPYEVGVRIGYDEALAHRIQGGADVIMVPSRAEPCGLTQLYGLRYGTLPLVRRTGGLEDTVIDATPAALADGCATGFSFGEAETPALVWAIRRAIDVYRTKSRWQTMQRTAMTRDFGWTSSARAYMELYQSLKPGR
ncbi:glycogen synthase [uncultured Gammaproteobacteria bacterium]